MTLSLWKGETPKFPRETTSDRVGNRRPPRCNAGISLHHLDVDASERWRRVQNRNVERGPTFRLGVTRKMFDFVETLWEPPSDAEMQRSNGNRIPQAK